MREDHRPVTVEESMARYEEWTRKRLPCREIYSGDCKIHIGPPRWAHRIDRYRTQPRSHPTHDQDSTAADVLRRIGDWDPGSGGEVREAARSNASYPGEVS